jgi:hypothetical protein
MKKRPRAYRRAVEPIIIIVIVIIIIMYLILCKTLGTLSVA